MRAAVASRAHDAEVGRVIAEQTAHSRNPVIIGTGALGRFCMVDVAGQAVRFLRPRLPRLRCHRPPAFAAAQPVHRAPGRRQFRLEHQYGAGMHAHFAMTLPTGNVIPGMYVTQANGGSA